MNLSKFLIFFSFLFLVKTEANSAASLSKLSMIVAGINTKTSKQQQQLASSSSSCIAVGPTGSNELSPNNLKISSP